MLNRLKNFLDRTGHPDEGYIPVAIDLPRDLQPRDTKMETAALGAMSGAAVGIATNPIDGAVAGAITAMGHRVATNAAWDEYDKMRCEVDEKLRQRVQPTKEG